MPIRTVKPAVCHQRQPGLIPLQSNPVVRDITSNGCVGGWMSLAENVIGAAIPNVFQAGALQWFRKAQGPVAKALPVSGQQPIRQWTLREPVI
ncbi:hypothetical protein TNCV_1601071 [Trichonephila clavipes]|nr:hypothetical protein TNCV_1601071 [Trichonephila clavipes]